MKKKTVTIEFEIPDEISDLFEVQNNANNDI